jgi:hypothetical protein
MADMVGSAGEEKAADGMQDAGIAVIGHGAAGRKLDATDPAGADVERRGQVELQIGSGAHMNFHQFPRSRIRNGTIT